MAKYVLRRLPEVDKEATLPENSFIMSVRYLYDI